jgi:hypothetical protein
MKQTGSKPLPRTRLKAVIVFSRIASFIFHPLLMTAIMAFALYKLIPGNFSDLAPNEFKKWMSELLAYTVLFPLGSILLFRVSGLISNARMHETRDRVLPLLATMTFYFLAYWIFAYKYKVPLLMQSLLLGSSCAIVIIFVINIFYKVSVHTTAAAILPGMCIALMLSGKEAMMLPLFFAILVAAIVGIIRWFLGAHTRGQIFLGYAVGIFTQVAAYFYMET